ncbi:MAG: PAS domain S-box protein, partial [Gemmatimonadota bacterium]
MLTGLYVAEGYRRFLHLRGDVGERIVLAAEGVATATAVTLDHTEEAMATLAERFGQAVLADPARCREVMTAAISALSYVTMVGVVDARGSLVCSTAQVPTGVGTDFSDREWFQRLVRTRSFTVGSPAWGRISQRPVVTAAAPIRGAGGGLMGAVAGGIEVARFQALLATLDSAEGFLVTVATDRNVIVARSRDPEAWVGRPMPPTDPSATVVDLGSGRYITPAPDMDGVPRTFGRVEIPGFGWRVWAGLPDSAVFAELLKSAGTDVLLGIGVLLLTWIIGVWVYRAVSRPLEVLAGSVREAAAGRPVPIPAGASVEVVNVVEALNRALEERLRAEDEARQARDRYRAMVDAAVFGIYLSTVDGRFLHVNPALVSMLGYDSVEELLAVPVGDLYRDPSRRDALLGEAMEEGRVEDLEVEWVRKDGESIFLRLNGTLVRTEDGTPAFEIIAENVSERRRLEELGLRRQKMEVVARLAGGVAHEFNNLLTVIHGSVGLMREMLRDDSVVGDELRAIDMAVRRADALTERLLAFSQRGVEMPEALSADEVIREMQPALQGVLGPVHATGGCRNLRDGYH